MLLIITLLFCSQLIYYKIFLTFFTLYSAGKGGQVLEFIPETIAFTKENLVSIILLFLPLFIYLIFIRKSITKYSFKFKEKALTFITCAVIFCLSILIIVTGTKDDNSPYDLYYRSNYPLYSVMNLGLITTFRLNAQRTIFGFSPDINYLFSNNSSTSSISENTFSNSSNSSNSSSQNLSNSDHSSSTESKPDVEGPSAPTPTSVPNYGYNTMNIDFNSLIKNSKNTNEKMMNEYFSNVTPTSKNEMTGKFKGYNLILITAEGFSKYSANKDVTPTLYKLINEGYNFTNFYTPIWGVSTSDGEYVATTGLIPKSGIWSMLRSGKNYMPFAMGNQLLPLGYKTVAYHDHLYSYYGRDVSHPNLGYTYKGVGNGLKIKKTWPESDLDMMQNTVDEFINTKSFHAYYMTVSGHLRYSFSGNYIANKNKALVANLPLSEGAKAYMATQIELDKALEYLLMSLEKAGIAQNTLIAVSADHYPYGLKKKDIDNLAGYEVESNFELYRNNFILYAKGMTPKTIDKPVSSLDINPTISNMLGLTYDSRLLMGVDCFSDSSPLVIFANKSFISDMGKYNSLTRVFTPNLGISVSDSYRKNISGLIDKKFYFSAAILDNDYYSILKKSWSK